MEKINKRYEYKNNLGYFFFYDNIFEITMKIKSVVDRLNYTHDDIIEKSKLINNLKIEINTLKKKLKRYE